MSAGNPITLDLKTKYVVKGIGKETTINSVVKIFTEEVQGEERIKGVEDRWDGEIPDGAIAKVRESSFGECVSVVWWVRLVGLVVSEFPRWVFGVFCCFAWTRGWVVSLRKFP